jgi:hypothetical protein
MITVGDDCRAVFNDDRPLGVNLLELHHDLGACARRPHRRDP